MWPNKTRPNKTAKLPNEYAVSENDPLVLILSGSTARHGELRIAHIDDLTARSN